MIKNWSLTMWTNELLWDFNIQMDHLISARRPDLVNINQKKRTYRIVDFAVLADLRERSKESENKKNTWTLLKEMKKFLNMKVTFISIVIRALGTVTKGLIKGLEDLEIRGQEETIQTTTWLGSAWILRRVLETWWDLLLLKVPWEIIG